MPGTQRTPITIKKWVWRALFTSTMIPLLLVETALVAVYFLSNNEIRDANLNYLQAQSNSELNLAMLREAKSLNRQLEHIQDLSTGMAEQARMIRLDSASPVRAEQAARHGFERSGAWASQRDEGDQASGFHAVLPDIEIDVPLALRMTAVDPLMRNIVSTHPSVIQTFVTLANCSVRIYPYVDLVELLPPDHDCRDFSFFYLAAPAMNPERHTVWTDLYQDPAANGWMTSVVTPFYDGDEFLGVVGIDMTLDVIVNQILAMELPWSGFAMLYDAKGRSLAVPSRGESLLSLAPVEQPDVSILQEEDVLRPAQMELSRHPVFATLSEQILGQRRGSASVSVDGEPFKVAWEHLSSNDWIMLSMVEESAVFSRTAEIGRNFQLVGMALVGGLILFYLSFFLLMSWRTHHISRHLSVPLAELRDRLHRIGMGAEVDSAGRCGIVELDDANQTAEEMYRRLRQTQQELQASERRLLDSLEASGDSLWEMDIPGRIIHIHPNLWRMLGATGREPLVMRELDFDRLIHPDDLEAVHVLRHRVFTTFGDTFECQYRMRPPGEEDLRHIESMGCNAHPDLTVEPGIEPQGGEGHPASSASRHDEDQAADAIDWVLLISRGRVVTWDAEGHPVKAAGMHIRIDRSSFAGHLR